MKKKLKPIPHFKTEDEEREFWWTHDSTDYVDWSKAKRVSFPNLKPTKNLTQSVTVRLPVELVTDIKTMANKQDVPYQSLMKVILHNAVKEEMKKYSTDKS